MLTSDSIPRDARGLGCRMEDVGDGEEEVGEGGVELEEEGSESGRVEALGSEHLQEPSADRVTTPFMTKYERARILVMPPFSISESSGTG